MYVMCMHRECVAPPPQRFGEAGVCISAKGMVRQKKVEFEFVHCVLHVGRVRCQPFELARFLLLDQATFFEKHNIF